MGAWPSPWEKGRIVERGRKGVSEIDRQREVILTVASLSVLQSGGLI